MRGSSNQAKPRTLLVTGASRVMLALQHGQWDTFMVSWNGLSSYAGPGYPQPIIVSKPMLQGAEAVGHSSRGIGFSGYGPMNVLHPSWQGN